MSEPHHICHRCALLAAERELLDGELSRLRAVEEAARAVEKAYPYWVVGDELKLRQALGVVRPGNGVAGK